MKVLIISVCNAENSYLIRRVCDAFPGTAVVKIQPAKPAHSNPQAQVNHNKYSSKTSLKAVLRSFSVRLRRRALIRKLYPHGVPYAIPKTIEVADIHSPEIGPWLSTLNPDVMLTFGAPILSPDLLKIGRLCTVNIHLGIPPKYRGNQTVFWAMKNHDFDHVGACLHHLAPNVDAGNILIEAFPALSRWSGELDARAGAVRLISSATVDYLKYLEVEKKGQPGLQQTDKGRNYKDCDRTMAISLGYLLSRLLLRGQPTPREDRVVAYYRLDETATKVEYETGPLHYLETA